MDAPITKTLARKTKLYTAFLDFEKMFDRIDRLFFYGKLINTNVSTRFVQAAKAMYSTVKSPVRFNSKLSDFIYSNIGVQQGDPSSSLLCPVFLNDILEKSIQMSPD